MDTRAWLDFCIRAVGVRVLGFCVDGLAGWGLAPACYGGNSFFSHCSAVLPLAPSDSAICFHFEIFLSLCMRGFVLAVAWPCDARRPKQKGVGKPGCMI